MTQNLPKSKAQKRLDDAAKDFVAMLERLGSGLVEIPMKFSNPRRYTITLKKCRKCKQEKDIKAFIITDTISKYCRLCTNL